MLDKKYLEKFVSLIRNSVCANEKKNMFTDI